MKYSILNFRVSVGEASISPLKPLKMRYKYLPLQLLGLPFSFKNEEATKMERKSGTVFN